jgi:hypothetical protein
MRPLTLILSLAISALTLSSGFTPASANRMNGKCCASSDGGRSHRHMMAIRRMAIRRAAIPHTCGAYAASCIRRSSARADRVPMCLAAKAQCIRTGVYVGPYSGWHFAGMQKK